MTLKVLCVAEKNDAAREISRLLSNNSSHRKEGLSKFNKIYEFSCQMLNNNARVSMTSVSGHLLTQDFSANFKGWEKCHPVSLFSAPILRFCPDNFQPIKKTLERESVKNEVLVLWTDCDREGENIASEIRDVCVSANSKIRVYRARFSEITFRSVKTAIERLESLDEKQVAAVDCRQELDLRIGAAFTRFLTMRLQKVFPAELSDQLVSYGPCQFPTLGFVVDRYKQVQQFVSETFYRLKALVIKDGTRVEFSWGRGRVFSRAVAEIFLELCQEQLSAVVSGVVSKPKSKWRPLPLDTVEFEKHASRKLHINAKQAMTIAEKLYTQGLISYPRTETNLFPASMDLVPLIQEQTQDGGWGDTARQILADTPSPRRGSKSDQAHPPIHPIKYASHLQGDEKKVYEFIVRHFLACCSKDAQGMETNVDVNVREEQFSASGLVITERNYLEVYPYDRWSDKDIPRFTQGDTVVIERVELAEGETTPPPLLKEADLIALMEKHGIGTDATHAEHIETIKSRRYVGVQPDGTFLPGTLGMGLVEGYDEIGYDLSKPYLRAELEADLKAICLGQKNRDEVTRCMIEKYKQVFIETTENAPKIDQCLSSYYGPPVALGPEQVHMGETGGEDTPLAKCRSCLQFDMYFRRMRDEKWMLSCAGYPQCKCSVFFPADVTQARTESGSLCDRCPHPPVHKARLAFKRGTIPYFLQHDGQNEFIVCLFCNEDIKRAGVEVRNMSSRPPAPLSSVSQPPSYTSVPHNNNDNNNFAVPSNRRDLGFDPTPISQVPPLKRYSDGPFQAPKQPKLVPPPRPPEGPEDNFVVCNCGTRANLLTVRKEGPNTGRKFYSCMTRSCGYFLWDPLVDPPMDTHPSQTQVPVYTPPPGDPFLSLYPNISEDGATHSQLVSCRCGETAKLLTVQKAGSNHGREFYGCAKPKGQGCNFFQWGDEDQMKTNNSFMPEQSYSNPIPPPVESSSSLQSGYIQSPMVSTSGDGSEVLCRCGEPGKLLTVQKAGQNQGRQFYACAKPREQGCGFFQWGDGERRNSFSPPSRGRGNSFSPPSRGRGNSFSPPSRGRGNSSMSSTNRGGPRLCSVCRQPGHNKKNCPNSNWF